VKQLLKMVRLPPVASEKNQLVSTRKRRIVTVNVNVSPTAIEAKNTKKKVGAPSTTTAEGMTPTMTEPMAIALRIEITLKNETRIIQRTIRIETIVVDLRNIMREKMGGNVTERGRRRRKAQVAMRGGNGMMYRVGREEKKVFQ